MKPLMVDLEGHVIVSISRLVLARLVADLVASCYDFAIPQYSHGAVCDLGCGYAPLYLKYKDYAESITLVDWGNSLHNNVNLDAEADLNEPLPFEDDEFDTIILSDVLEHIYKPRQLLCEIARCLRENGNLLANVPFCYNLHEVPHDYYRYTRFALQKMIEESGLKTVCLCEIGTPIDSIVNIVSKWLGSRGGALLADKMQKW